MRATYDIIVVTDPRLTGGGNKSLAEEIRAHASAGYTTGLLPLASAIPRVRSFDSSVTALLDDGLIEVVRPDQPLHTRLLIARGPRLFLEKQVFVPDVTADTALIVANAVHRHTEVSDLAYVPAEAAAAADELFGLHWRWVPLSGVVRRWLTELDPELDVDERTWSNVIDVDAWRFERIFDPTPAGPIGRHARDSRVKWPGNRDDLLAVYPDDPELRVEILGGADIPREILDGRLPRNWQIHRFNRLAPRTFLTQLDAFVYQHHPEWIEAFGRAPLEAMAVGVPVVLPHYLDAIFGEGAQYASTERTRSVVDGLLNDPGRWWQQREAGFDIAHQHFSHQHHLRRLDEVIGPPSRSMHTPAVARSQTTADEGRQRIAFFSDNGHGLGHITRLMAIAQRLPTRSTPVFLTLSESHDLVRDMGFPAEYFASARKMGIDREIWEQFFWRRMSAFLREVRPSALVIDHVNPPTTLRRLRDEHPDVALVWSRRGLWRRGRNRKALDLHDVFDLVIEPMDVASAVDHGHTIRFRDALYVPPVTFVGQEELIDRASARAALGLPPNHAAVLLQLSADGPAAMKSVIARARDLIRDSRPVTLFAPLHVLHAHALEPVDGVHMQPVYPVARYLRAFDAAISTAGYNSFHELIMAAVPTLFVARDTNSLDDQPRRAEVARLAGAGLHVPSLDHPDAHVLVTQLLDDQMRARLSAAAATLYPGNGAPVAATAVDELASRHREHGRRGVA